MARTRIPVDVMHVITELDKEIPLERKRGTGQFMFRRRLEVWSMQVIEERAEIYKTVDHVHRMRMAYLIGGCAGIWDYVKDYVKPAMRESIKAIVMHPDKMLGRA